MVSLQALACPILSQDLLSPCLLVQNVSLLDEPWDGVEAMSEQQASPNSRQSWDKAAQPEAPGAVTPATHPAVQASGSFGDAEGYSGGDDVDSSGGDDVMGGCSGGSRVDSDFSDADSASSMASGSRSSSRDGSSHGRRSSVGGSSVDEGAAADSGLAPVAPPYCWQPAGVPLKGEPPIGIPPIFWLPLPVSAPDASAENPATAPHTCPHCSLSPSA